MEKCATIVFVATLLQPTHRSISNGSCAPKKSSCTFHLKEIPIDPAPGESTTHSLANSP